jgi:methyl-accepting chemotaxis protein
VKARDAASREATASRGLAMRAGEHGRGFAVVAQEVRSLSQRCTDAAREVRSLVADTGRQLAESAAEVDRLAESLAEINGAVQEVTRLMDLAATQDA